MRILLGVVLLVSAAAFAETTAIPAKTRAAMEKLDARISLLNENVRQNAIKQAEHKNTVETLREKVNQAKNPENRARLEKALDNNTEKLKTCEALIAADRKAIEALLAERRELTRDYTAEAIDEKQAARRAEAKTAREEQRFKKGGAEALEQMKKLNPFPEE